MYKVKSWFRKFISIYDFKLFFLNVGYLIVTLPKSRRGYKKKKKVTDNGASKKKCDGMNDPKSFVSKIG